MAERRKRLTAKLGELDEQLSSDGPVQDELAEPLKEALGSLREVVETPPGDNEGQEELGETIGDLALSLEVSHPKLTRLLNQISEILAGAGI